MQPPVPLSSSVLLDPSFNVFADPYWGVQIENVPTIPTEEEFQTQETFLVYDLDGRHSEAREHRLSLLHRIHVMIKSVLVLSITAFSLSSLASRTWSRMVERPYMMGAVFALYLLSLAIQAFAKFMFKRNRSDYTTYLQSQARKHLQADSGLPDRQVPHKAMAMLFMKAVDPSRRDAELFIQASQAFNAYLTEKIQDYNVHNGCSTAMQYAHHFFGDKSRQFDSIYEHEVRHLYQKGRFKEAIEVATHIMDPELRDSALTFTITHNIKGRLQADNTRQDVITSTAQWIAKVEKPGLRNDLCLKFLDDLLPYSLEGALQFLYHIDALCIKGRGTLPTQQSMTVLVDRILKYCYAQDDSSFPFAYALDAILLLDDLEAMPLLNALNKYCAEELDHQEGMRVTPWFIFCLSSTAFHKQEMRSSYIYYKQRIASTPEQQQDIELLVQSGISDTRYLQTLSPDAQAKFAEHTKHTSSIAMRVYWHHRLKRG